MKWVLYFGFGKTSVVVFYRTTADNNYSNSSLDENGDNIQSNAYNMYKLLNNSNDQTSLTTFNETFHSGTNKLYSFNSAGITNCAYYLICTLCESFCNLSFLFIAYETGYKLQKWLISVVDGGGLLLRTLHCFRNF